MPRHELGRIPSGGVRIRRVGPTRHRPPPRVRSAGLCTPDGPRFRTCVWIIVVETSAWPGSSCTVRRSDPSSIRTSRPSRRAVYRASPLGSTPPVAPRSRCVAAGVAGVRGLRRLDGSHPKKLALRGVRARGRGMAGGAHARRPHEAENAGNRPLRPFRGTRGGGSTDAPAALKPARRGHGVRGVVFCGGSKGPTTAAQRRKSFS